MNIFNLKLSSTKGESMKAILTIAVLILSQASFAANEHAELSTFDLDPARFEKEVGAAKVVIDEVNGVAQLLIRYKTVLRPVTHDETITLPILSKESGACGVTVYTAQMPSRAVGAPIETMIISDYRSIVCRIKIANDQMTQVELGNVIKGETAELQNVSVFSGEALESKEIL
jgi:hypothetical protein